MAMSNNLAVSSEQQTDRRSERRPHSSCDLRPPPADWRHRSHSSMDAGHADRKSIRSLFFSKKRSASNLQQPPPPPPKDEYLGRNEQPEEDVQLDLSSLCPPPSTPEFVATPERIPSPAPSSLIWLPDEEMWMKAEPSMEPVEEKTAHRRQIEQEAQLMQLSFLLNNQSSAPTIVLDDPPDQEGSGADGVPPPCYVQSQWEEATKRQTTQASWWGSVAQRRLETP
ncbi:MAG: hypothetical protein M1833_000585 [Piccolia ochrophora]|nr:MAG: hypothetical protein M1833_000585 [Piccolia ochrophora]